MDISSSKELFFSLGGSVAAAIVAGLSGLVLTRLSRDAARVQSLQDKEKNRIVRMARRALETSVSASLGLPAERSAKIAGMTVGRDIIFQSAPAGGTGSVQEGSSVEELVTGYHEQALSQARVQFWFSVAAATVGFGWILYAGLDIRPENLVSISKTLPGIVLDAVAFLFFKQASETRQRATELYDRLRTDKLSAGAILLADSIDDLNVRSLVKAQMALHMSGIKPPETDLAPLLTRQPLSAGNADIGASRAFVTNPANRTDADEKASLS